MPPACLSLSLHLDCAMSRRCEARVRVRASAQANEQHEAGRRAGGSENKLAAAALGVGTRFHAHNATHSELWTTTIRSLPTFVLQIRRRVALSMIQLDGTKWVSNLRAYWPLVPGGKEGVGWL